MGHTCGVTDTIRGAERRRHDDDDAQDDLRDKACDSPVVEGLGRAGLAARGVLYSVVGVLALQLALGRKTQRPDNQGALAALAHQPFGKVLLVITAVGFAGYALWRFSSAFLDTEGDGSDASGWAKRAADLGRGLLYASFCFTALRLVAGSSGDDQTKEADITAAVLRAPWGRILVALVGLAIIGAGLYNGYRAVSRKYRKNLHTEQMSQAARRWLTRVASVGLTARMIVFVLVGAFLVRSAVRYDPNEAVGVDGALQRLMEARYGPWMLALVAVGLFTFGLYSFIEARYRRLMER